MNVGRRQQLSRRRDRTEKIRIARPTVAPRPTEEALAALNVGAMVTLLDRNPPEPLIELGAALGGGGPLAVVRVREIPEQLAMQDLTNDHPYELALRRRALTMGDNLRVQLEYVNAACRGLRYLPSIGTRWELCAKN